MILAAKVALVCAGTVVAGAGALCSEGFVRVNVTGSGAQPHHVDVIAPAMLVPIAVDVGRHFAPRRKIADAADKIEPWMPAIRAALSELDRSDDLTLVDVTEPGERVRVEKVGGSVVVNVEDREQSVHVSAPIRAISSTIQQIADAEYPPNP